MKTEVHILMLEDSDADAELMLHALRKGGMVFSCDRAETKADFLRALAESPPDVILSDYSLPGFDGYAALGIALKKCPETPFIFVTGALGEEVAIETLIRCRVTSSVKDTLWDQDLNTAFFRIFQETLTNVIRHANATRVDVLFMETGHGLVLKARDNGRGISEAELHNPKSVGLLGMRERVALLDGQVSVQGQPGQGTTVTVSIPRPKAKLNDHENSSDRRPRRRAAGVEAYPG